jgi:hypothetical protein
MNYHFYYFYLLYRNCLDSINSLGEHRSNKGNSCRTKSEAKILYISLFEIALGFETLPAIVCQGGTLGPLYKTFPTPHLCTHWLFISKRKTHNLYQVTARSHESQVKI